MTEERMLYRRYKQSFSDCETLPGSYDKNTKSIVVLLQDCRLKKSGVRGQRYMYLTFNGVENQTGRKVNITIKAISRENAIKKLPITCTWEL